MNNNDFNPYSPGFRLAETNRMGFKVETAMSDFFDSVEMSDTITTHLCETQEVPIDSGVRQNDFTANESDKTLIQGIEAPRLEIGSQGFTAFQNTCDFMLEAQRYAIDPNSTLLNESQGPLGAIFLMEQASHILSRQIEGFERLSVLLTNDISPDKIQKTITNAREYFLDGDGMQLEHQPFGPYQNRVEAFFNTIAAVKVSSNHLLERDHFEKANDIAKAISNISYNPNIVPKQTLSGGSFEAFVLRAAGQAMKTGQPESLGKLNEIRDAGFTAEILFQMAREFDLQKQSYGSIKDAPVTELHYKMFHLSKTANQALNKS